MEFIYSVKRYGGTFLDKWMLNNGLSVFVFIDNGKAHLTVQKEDEYELTSAIFNILINEINMIPIEMYGVSRNNIVVDENKFKDLMIIIESLHVPIILNQLEK